VEFDPKAIKINDVPPSIFINSLKVMNEDQDSLLQVTNLTLHHNQNAFEFGFTALNLTNAEMNRYSYKLEGVDQEWVDAGNTAFARYADLSGGDYTFKVKAANNHGIWNENAATFSFSIIPPIWKRWWFYPLLSLLAIVIGIGIYRMRVRNLHKQQMEKLKAEVSAQEKERSRLAQDLHDDLGTKMSALKLYLNTLEVQVGEEHTAQSISKSAQGLLDESIGDLRSMLNNLSPKIVREFGYFKAAENLASRLSETGAISIRCDFNVAQNRFHPSAELALYRVTQELIHNAIKHADCEEITLSVKQNEDFYHFFYRDNGKGFISDYREGEHYGLANMQNRIQVENGIFSLETKPGAGVSVHIDLPITPNYYV